MISFYDDLSFISYDKYEVLNTSNFPHHHDVVTDSVIDSVTSSVPNSLDIHGSFDENETHSIRTHTLGSCTYKNNLPAAAAFDTIHDNNNSISSLEKAIEQHKHTANIIQQPQKRRRSYFHTSSSPHKPHFNNNNNDNIITSTDIHKENIDTNNYNNSNSNSNSMVNYSTINNNNPWTEQGPHDHDGGRLSPQMVKTVIDLSMKKNDATLSNLWGGIEFPPDKPRDAAGRRKEKGEQPSCCFDDDHASEMAKLDALMEEKVNKLVSGIDTDNDSEEDQYCPPSDDNDGRHCDSGNVDDVNEEEYDDDDESSSIASSSSDDIFEFFDDMSMLTNEDSIEDDDGDYIILEIFEVTEDTKDEELQDVRVSVFSLVQGDLVQDHRHEQEQEQDAMDDYIEGDKVKLSEALKDSVLLDFLVGFCSNDELRLM